MLWERGVNPEVRSSQSIAPSITIEGYPYLVSAKRVDERFRPSKGRVYADRARLGAMPYKPIRVRGGRVPVPNVRDGSSFDDADPAIAWVGGEVDAYESQLDSLPFVEGMVRPPALAICLQYCRKAW
jgi:hypothetical protein